jgi:chemotaxis protein histidine kinase CheA
MQTAENFQGRMATLTSRFVGTMPQRVTDIAETLTRCSRDSLTAAPLLERQFHSLAGTAGTYGLEAIAAVAAEGEETCSSLGDGSIDENLTYLNFLVSQLRAAAGDYAPLPPDRYMGIVEGSAVV